MNQKLRYLSYIKDDFDTVICGVNGVITHGKRIIPSAVESCAQLYQNGKKVFLASDAGLRVNDLFCFLRTQGVPLNIFNAMITAGEICHYYLKSHDLGHSYYSLNSSLPKVMQGLDTYRRVEKVIMSDFLLIENEINGIDIATHMNTLQQALSLNLPLVCIGNNISLITEQGIKTGAGALAEQYAMMGGKIISFGKPDHRITKYLTENIYAYNPSRCLIIGDSMATDIRLGNLSKAQTLLLCDGVHQIYTNEIAKINELSTHYGLNVDYYMERLQW